MSSSAPDLSVDSDTGIDVSLPVAGPGARAFAFVIDWHIRLVLALTWYATAAVIFNRHLSLAPPVHNDAHWFGLVLAPALAIYFLYHYILEPPMQGHTPGKRMAGVRIVARDGGTPSVGALLVRNVFRLVDCLPAFYGVGLLATFLSRDHLRIGDMAAGTLLVYEHDPAQLPSPLPAGPTPGRLDPSGAEIVAELLERWPTLAPEAREQLAQQVLARYGTAAAGAPEGLREQLQGLLRGAAGRA